MKSICKGSESRMFSQITQINQASQITQINRRKICW